MQTILIVDDQEIVRDAAKALVEWCGFATMEAASGAEALQVFELHREQISGVLLDMVMPELSGEATLLLLQQSRADLPIVMMSGMPKEDVSDFLLRHAEVGFVQKPYHVHELLASLNSVLVPSVEAAVGE